MKFEEVLERCHWIEKIDEYHYELYLDHHMLSTFRQCEQYFVHTMIEGWKHKSELRKMPWFFAIGIAVHDAVEYLYAKKQDGVFDHYRYATWLMQLWKDKNMDWYASSPIESEQKAFKALAGLDGFVALMIQYVEFYNEDRERMRPIATEVAFGRGKEAPLGSFKIPIYSDDCDFKIACEFPHVTVDCFLAGRIDFLMDNGRIIGPVDHKTTGFFDGDQLGKYDPQEGMTGYIYTSKKVIEHNFPEIAKERDTNSMWMNFISLNQNVDANKRFKRLPLRKTDWQLEEYRKRQLRTFEKIFDLIYNEKDPDWNTNICSNMFRRDCQFKAVHRQRSLDNAFLIMSQDFQIAPIWNADLSHEKEEKK